MMSLKFHIRDIMLAFYVANKLAYPYLWEEIKGTGVLGPFYRSCRPALCVWHSLVASHFITRILTTRILFITQEVTFAVASDEFKRERVKEYVPKKSSTYISEGSLCTAFAQLPSQAASPG